MDLFFRNIADELDLNMTPESLSAYYNELYGNYQTFKEMQQNGANLDVDFGYFQEFDEIYGDDFQDYEVVEEIIPENIHIKQEIIQVVEQKREVNEDQLHAIADNFMTTCKFCLKQNKEEHLKAVTEDVAEKINYVLHENVS